MYLQLFFALACVLICIGIAIQTSIAIRKEYVDIQKEDEEYEIGLYFMNDTKDV